MPPRHRGVPLRACAARSRSGAHRWARVCLSHEGPGQQAGDRGQDSCDSDGRIEAGQRGGDAADQRALVSVTVDGVNYMDIAARSMPLPGWGLPAAMGVEGTGRIEAIGAAVENLAPGDRVAWFYHPGSYADLARGPGGVPRQDPRGGRRPDRRRGDDAGPDRPSPGRRDLPVAAGDTAVVLAAAGGSAIGLVSREDKAPAARRARTTS